jgi:hypothetical protein
LGQQAEVPFGHFRRVLMTKDTNRLEPDVLEFKFFARGVVQSSRSASRAAQTARSW